MYSNPSFDPNLLSGHDLTKVQANYKALTAQPGAVLAPGAYRQRYFPGSTFKIITASAVYDHAPQLATKVYPTLAALPLPQTTNLLHNFGGETCGGQMLELFTVSCNTGFGQIGLDLGANALYSEAKNYGFNQVTPIDLPFPAVSTFPPPSAFTQDLPGLAFSAIGQQNVESTPLEMAMVAGAIANRGTIMTPHILGHVTNSQNQVVSTYQPKPWLQATSPATAAQVTQLMVSVVNDPDGTGTAARIPGVAGGSQDRYRPDRDRKDQCLVRGVRPRRQPDDRGGGDPPQPACSRRVPGGHPGRPHRQSYDRGISGRRDRDVSGPRLPRRPRRPPHPAVRPRPMSIGPIRRLLPLPLGFDRNVLPAGLQRPLRDGQPHRAGWHGPGVSGPGSPARPAGRGQGPVS